MACFPRLFHRSKSSFNPAEDDNTDTILNNSDSSVQIGKYVRREETPVFTPKSSETARQQQQQQKQILPKEPARSESIITNNNNSNATLNKKFISRSRSKTNSTVSSNNSNSITTSSAHPKLKPVKERRPTALPSEVPKIEDDIIDGTYSTLDITNHADSNELNGYISSNCNTPTSQNVRFFVGAQNLHDDAYSQLDDLEKKSWKLSNSSKKTLDTLNGDHIENTTEGEGSKSSSCIATFLPRNTATKTKLPSNTNNKQRKGPPPSQRDREDVNIPIPPPLPPEPLTKASSSASLVSSKSSSKSKHYKSNSNIMENTDFNGTQTQMLFEAETTLNAKSNFDMQSCTLSELLRIGNCATGAANSINGRDSGVQIEDQSSTPKESDISNSVKSHRTQGGLIFTRPNLPIQTDIEIKYITKNERTRTLIRTAIEKNDFLNNYMDNERKEMVIDAMAPATFEKDSYIIRENDEGSEIYVSESGEFEVIKNGKVIGDFGATTVFGELAILYNAKRFASIKAATYAQVWKIKRETFRNIMLISGSKEREENLHFLRSAPLLKDLSRDVLDRIVDLLQRKFYEANTCIVCEGEVGNEFFIIRGGTVTIKKKTAEGVERVVDRRKRGDYFGEQALLNADCRQASVYADAPGTEVLKLDREAFISYLGTIPQLREKPEDRGDTAEGRESRSKSKFDNEYAHVQLTELKKVATLGAGAFGRVDLVAYGNKTFALKIIKKIDILKQDQVEHVYSEKHVMMTCRSSPFIIELYKTFRNEKFVYFLMEACMGGDVWTIMSQRRFFDEKTARFIAGCVVEAFSFLHAHNIIYRDLKPENLMLTTDGYCKLVDFGFAKHIPLLQKTSTFAGTPEYVAPEIILDRGHDRAVDYWALGILIFELLVGKTPFRGENQIKIYQQILGGIDVIQMPSKIPKSAQGLIKHLCKQLPVERLGYQRKGIMDIKRHSWFDSLDWNKLKNKQLTSPIKRSITSNTDLQYFGPAGVENEHDPPDETSGWDIDF